MFIQTEETPNPLTLKFLPGRDVMLSGTLNLPMKTQAWKTPLAVDLFEITGVGALFFGADFISVTKNENADWAILKPQVLGTIMEYFLTHDHVDVRKSEQDAEDNSSEDDEIVREIKDIVETRIRPAVAQDGGDIIFNRFEDGVVYLELQGACSGCPSSTITLKNGIENMLRHYIPEVNEVRATG